MGSYKELDSFSCAVADACSDLKTDEESDYGMPPVGRAVMDSIIN